MRKIALDTNIAVDLLNGQPETIERLQKVNIYYLPITVCGELLFGAMNSKNRTSNLRRFKAFIGTCKILNTTIAVAIEYAAIRSQLKKDGTPIPENDIWIAATCRVNKITLASRDKHFDHIGNLKLLKIEQS